MVLTGVFDFTTDGLCALRFRNSETHACPTFRHAREDYVNQKITAGANVIGGRCRILKLLQIFIKLLTCDTEQDVDENSAIQNTE